jgi:hypothetical protein
MSRVVVFTLVTSLASSSLAFAGETLVQSATRIAQDVAQAQPSSPSPSPSVAISRRDLLGATRADAWASRPSAPAVALQEAPGVLSKSGMRKRTKLMIYSAVGIGFVAGAWTIDHHVKDITPSSLGTRQD